MNQVLAYVTASDMLLSGRLLTWHSPRWFRLWMLWATRLGDGWIWLVTGVALMAKGGTCWRALALGAIAAGIGNALLVLLKRRFRRRRPRDYGLGGDYGLGRSTPFAFDEFSFPSGHTINAFSIGTAISLTLPVILPVALICALSIAASRVVLGMHFVSDVLAGALIGTLVGMSTVLLLG